MTRPMDCSEHQLSFQTMNHANVNCQKVCEGELHFYLPTALNSKPKNLKNSFETYSETGSSGSPTFWLLNLLKFYVM